MADDSLAALLAIPAAEHLIRAHAAALVSSSSSSSDASSSSSSPSADAPPRDILAVALLALDAFLQANVTGPVLPAASALRVETLFAETSSLRRLRRAALAALEVDGVCPYAHIPRLELFSLARHLVLDLLHDADDEIFLDARHSRAWAALRIHAWHYKLLTQPSLGPGSNFNRSAQWIDVPSLAAAILDGIDAVRGEVLRPEAGWARDDRALLLVETASHYIALGRHDKAREALGEAAATTGFTYALTGALGKRTRFQETDISQLVVLAKSSVGTETEDTPGAQEEGDTPDQVPLNDDTLLEQIRFAAPDDQPRLDAVDAMVLLAEATMRDAFAPADALTAEQILPFAARVLADRAVNWQVYTQALLVRSRIEAHRSRTVERGVLQLQAVADQVIAETTEQHAVPPPRPPVIQVSSEVVAAPVPATFLPAAKPSESAPARVRLRYVHALASPPRWHLESELAFGWAGVGSMASALDIFKRLRLWAEVALCLASAAAARSDEGKASSGEHQAIALLRWRLFSRTGALTPDDDNNNNDDNDDDNDDDEVVDVGLLRAEDWAGPERRPPPPDAPRLLCILGDLESAPSHYERAWSLSRQRYARAQRSLGEHHVRLGAWPAALNAYRLATAANRISPDAWSRRGDISLRLGLFDEAATSFTRAIGCASDAAGGEGARTWSNLGSALWSLYLERTNQDALDTHGPERTNNQEEQPLDPHDHDDHLLEEEEEEEQEVPQDPAKLLRQALAAYQRGAALAHDNWRIWDNVLTLTARIHPFPLQDALLALTHILRIRHSEHALDAGLLAALLQTACFAHDDQRELPPGSHARAASRFVEEHVVPLITRRSELWALVARLRAWRGDLGPALDAAEKAWRAAVTPTPSSSTGTDTHDWTEDATAWEDVVLRTDELVSMLENYGPRVEGVGPRWKGKARSALRSVMGRGRERWDGTPGWKTLETLLEGVTGDS